MSDERLDKLAGIQIFQHISSDDLRSLLDIMLEQKYSANENIFVEGDHADSIYILDSGSVEVRKVTSRDPLKYKTMAIFEAGDIFGEMAFFGEEKRSADIIAREDSAAWKLEYNDLLKVISTDPQNGVKILHVIMALLVARIKFMNSELAVLFELGKILPGINDLENLAISVFDQLKDVLSPSYSGYLAISNEFNEEFTIYEKSGSCMDTTIGYDDPLALRIFRDNSPVIEKDAGSGSEFNGKFYSGRSFIASPLMDGSELLGFILLNDPEKTDAFSNNHMVLLMTICSQAAARVKRIEQEKEELLKKQLEQSKAFGTGL